jgi:hypothetical protein
VALTDSVATAVSTPRTATLSRRLWLVGLLAFGVLVLIPTWIVLPPDDEGLFLVILPTWFQSHFLFSSYPQWNPFVEFGGAHPGSESLIFHPFVVLLHWASPAFSIGLLYQVQLWIGLLSIWGVCRYLDVRRWVAAVCALTYTLGSVTLSLLYNFWPDLFVAWTLSPLLLLLLLKLLDSEKRTRRAFYSVAAGLCAALMILDGHTGVFPTFGIAFIAFLLGDFGRVKRVWPWLALAAGVLVASVGTRIFDLALETSRTPNAHAQQVYPFDFAHFFFYPIFRGAHDVRNTAFGLPFTVLAIVGLFWRGAGGRHALALRIAGAVACLGWFMPVHWIPALSGNWLFGQPFTLFAIVLAAVTLSRLWDAFPSYRPAIAAVGVAQSLILVVGFWSYYHTDLRRSLDYLDGKNVPTLMNVFKQQDIYRFFESQPDHAGTRVLMTQSARVRLWRTLTDYTWTSWEMHGLRLVNGHLRGDDMSEFQETKEALHGEIRGEQDLWRGPDDLERNADVLTVLDVGYVLATPTDHVANGLVPIHRFRLTEPSAADFHGDAPLHQFVAFDPTTIVVYRNPAHWADAHLVAPDAKALKTFPQRSTCQIPGLLCDNVSAIARSGRPGVTTTHWDGLTLDVGLKPSAADRVLMVSQQYRPGWHAKLSNGETISGFRLFGSVTGFDIPAGVTSAKVFFHATNRLLFSAISWITVLGSATFLIIAALMRWHREAGRGL